MDGGLHERGDWARLVIDGPVLKGVRRWAQLENSDGGWPDDAGVDAVAPPRISMLGVILLACFALHAAMLLRAIGEGRLGWTV